MFSLKTLTLTLAIAAASVLAESECDKAGRDTLCSPEVGSYLHTTFDVKYHARHSTDYIELAFYSTDDKHKRAINKRYSTREAGRDDVIKANDVKVPCGLDGKYDLVVSRLTFISEYLELI